MTEDLFPEGVLAALAVIAGICISFTAGWAAAHSTVTNECKKLGVFYVGKVTYKCSIAPEKGQT